MFCNQCGRFVHEALALIVNELPYCDRACVDGETTPALFREADYVGRKYNTLFSQWEKTARKET